MTITPSPVVALSIARLRSRNVTTLVEGESDHPRLNAFLNFGGNCEQAIRFYEQHLAGEITMLMRCAESQTSLYLARLGTVNPVRHHEDQRDGARELMSA